MQIGSQLSTYATVDNVGKVLPSETLAAYMGLFYRIGSVTILIGIALVLTIKPTHRAMEQIKQHRT